MRSFGIVLPQFWTGRTGKELKECRDAQVLAFYLMTGPSSHMSGLYNLAFPLIEHHAGLKPKETAAAFKVLSDARFAFYDADTEYVFVKEMLHFQVGPLKPTASGKEDNRKKAVQNWYRSLPANPFLAPFFDRYGREYDLEIHRDCGTTYKEVLLEGASASAEGVSLDKEKEKDKERDKEQPLATPSPEPKYSEEFQKFWMASTRRGPKVDAFTVWKALRPDAELQSRIHAGMQAWQASQQWQDETKQPHVHRWLKRRGWDEQVPRSPQPENSKAAAASSSWEEAQAYRKQIFGDKS